jgi:cobalamin biosynthesis Mg chelatase CobN
MLVAIVGLILAWRQFDLWIKGQSVLVELMAEAAKFENDADSKVAEFDAASIRNADVKGDESSSSDDSAKTVFTSSSSSSQSSATSMRSTRRILEDLKNSVHSLNTKIEASKNGISVTTPILGVTVLIIDLGFFYFFVRYVWPSL